MAYQVEYTDTFGGEANYSWVKRASIQTPSCDYRSPSYRSTLMRRAKAAMGLSGVRGVTYWHGDMAEFRPYRMCRVMFVTRCD